MIDSSVRIHKILWVPGLGADMDMYLPIIRELLRHKQWTQFALVTDPVHLLRPRKSESLEEYTERVFEEHPHTKTSSTDSEANEYDMVVATSMGGMIAQIALEKGLIKTKSLVLVSTVMSGNDLTVFARLGDPLLPLTPRFLRRPIQIVMALVYPLARFYLPYSILFSRMLMRADPDLLFLAPRMIRNWRRDRGDGTILPENTVQFHGTMDPLLSCKRVCKRRKPEHVFAGASHLVFVTHARVIAKRILETIASLDAR